MGRAKLRIHFTADDLGRVRLAPAVDSMWEITLSLHLLPKRESPLVFDHWRGQVRNAIGRSGADSMLSLLLAIDPPASYFPDFLTPFGYRGDFAEGIEAIRSTPAGQFREQLALLSRNRTLPIPARSLATGDGEAIERLVEALRTYHAIALAPFQRQIDYRIAAVRDWHREHLTTGGSEALLRSLAPLGRWEPPVLEFPFPSDADLHLDGRGLLLVPSFFCVGAPVKYFSEELPPTVVYPITHDPGWSVPSPAEVGDSLSLLIGGTRAGILHHIASSGAASTQDLAGRLHVAAATASYHTKVLREAGLITSRRDGALVVHRVTLVGAALLNGVSAPPGPALDRIRT
jgi:DNA-binding transcriptional ArsR family regulator